MLELQLVMYIIHIVMLRLVGVMDKRQVVTDIFHAIVYRLQVVISILQFVIEKRN